MLNEINDSQAKMLRKLVGAALCDFITYVESIEDPFIVGGQYPNDKFVNAFHAWLLSRKFELEGANKHVKNWIRLYQQGTFAGPKDSDTSPSENHVDKSPKSPKSPKPSKPPQEENVTPDDGYYNGDDWKPELED